MKKIKRLAAAVLCILCLTVNLVCKPVRTEAFVLEATAAAGLAELLETFVISAGASYMASECLAGVKDFYGEWSVGIGSKLYDKVMTKAKLDSGYWGYVDGSVVYKENWEPESSGDPEKTSEPEGDKNENESGENDKIKRKLELVMDSGLVAYATEFWSDYFETQEPEAITMSRRMIKYDVAEGAIKDVYFGGYVVNKNVQTSFTRSGIEYLDGVMQTAYDRSESGWGYYSFTCRFHEKFYTEHADCRPFMKIGGRGTTGYDISYYAMNEEQLWTKSYEPLLKNSYSYSRVFNGTYHDFSENSSSYGDHPPLDKLYGIYDSVPDSFVYDGTVDRLYYWNGTELFERNYDQISGQFTDTSVENGYIYTSDGVYLSLSDIYSAVDGSALVLERLQNMGSYLETLAPEELPRVDYAALEGLNQQLAQDKKPYMPEYPAPLPDSPEVPDSYPDKLDETYREFIEENKPETSPENNPENDPNKNEDKDKNEDEDKDKENAGSHNKNDYALSLMDFFPFCLPNDIYHLVKIMAAEPEAPKFTWNIPTIGSRGSPGEGSRDNLVTVDLSPWDDAAAVFRGMQDAVLIFILVRSCKKLVKGG